MKRFYAMMLCLGLTLTATAQGWPSRYGGVMLQGFSWDSYSDSQWSVLEKQADELSSYFNLIWVPQSGKCLEDNQVMGYTPYYYFNQNSSFGTETELRSMIKTFKSKGLGTIADVVINHHNTNGWYGFPAETYNGVTYQLLSTDICANDDGGSTKTQAAKDGVSLSSNDDEGEDWNGCRDLDHKSSNVQTVIKAYEKFLVDDMGYTGFRYDMVKGFAASHIGDYNDAAGVEYSVGEYWDGNASIENWITSTGKKSAAFDFQFRYNVRDAANNNNWTKLNSTNNLMHDAAYRRYAVTFVENHDMQDRGTTSGYTADPIKRDTLAANAYMLAMPGTPCVFLPHWKSYKQEIKSMIEARKLAGITNESDYTNKSSTTTCFANEVTGGKGSLVVVVGSKADTYQPGSGYTQVLSGYHYRYYLSNSVSTAWIDKASGDYDQAFKATVKAVTSASGAKLVYTTDGTTPTAGSKQIASGSAVDISSTCTLTVGLLINGAVTGVVSQTYNFDKEEFKPYTIKVYVNADNAGWTTTSGINYHSWGGVGQTGTSWPGKKVTATETVNGKTWFVNTYTITTSDDYVSFVFSTGTGKPQTVDVTNVRQTTYFEIQSTKSASGNNQVSKVAVADGIESVTVVPSSTSACWYTIGGMRLDRQPTAKGIYIHQGKKVVVK